MSTELDKLFNDPSVNPEVWVVSALYNESDNLPVLYERLQEVAEQNTQYRFKYLFIDDGSKDNTFALIDQLASQDERVAGLRLSRNTGAHAAVTAGLAHVTGDCAVVMAADLQDPPELLPSLLTEWRGGAKVVWAVRKTVHGRSLFQSMLSNSYWWVMRKLVPENTHPRGADFFLLDQDVVQTFNAMPERNRSVLSMISWMGYDQKAVHYEKEQRLHGRSKWNYIKKINFALDSFVGYTYLPMRVMSVIGMLFTVMSLLYSSLLVWNYFSGHPAPGWSSIMIVILLAAGLQMTMLGILGEYLWRTLDEARGRPYYIVDQRLNINPGAEGIVNGIRSESQMRVETKP